MSTFVFYADQQHKMRADGRNTVIAEGADANAARLIGEALLGSPGALAKFAVVDISASFPAFTVEGFRPVGARSQDVWPTITRGGDSLPGVDRESVGWGKGVSVSVDLGGR